MIPKKKKTPEEIAALREGLGIPDEIPPPGAPRQRTETDPLPVPEEPTPNEVPPAPDIAPVPLSDKEPSAIDEIPSNELRERVVHLDLPPAPTAEPDAPVYHSLRKHELPLAPAPFVTSKTALPAKRHDSGDIAQIRKREALAKLADPVPDPMVLLKKITAGPLLLIPAYLLAIGAAATAWQRVHHVTPIVLLVLCSALALFIFIRKKRSRHHAAILAIMILMTLAFGGLHYAPLFQHAP